MSAEAELPDSARIWRRITPQNIVFDENVGARRISSAAFSPPKGLSELSVVIADDIEAREGSHRLYLASFPHMGLAELLVGEIRKLRLDVVRSPLPDEPAHADIRGNLDRQTSRKLAMTARVLFDPGPNNRGDAP